MSTLAADALTRAGLVPPAPDHGSLVGDLVALFAPWTQPLTAAERAAAALLGPAAHDSTLQGALDASVARPLARAVDQVVDQHAGRGHPVDDRDRRLVGVLVQSLWWDRFITDRSASTVEEVTDLVTRALVPVVMQR